MLVQKIVLSYGTKLIVQVVQMATSLIVARLVGPGVIGTLAYGLAFSSMFSFVADLGTGTAHIKHISSGLEEPVANSTYGVLKLFLMVVYLLITLGAFGYTKYFTDTGFDSADQEKVVLIYIIIALIGQLTTIYSTTWAGRTEQAKQDIPLFVQSISYQIIKLILAVLGFLAIGIAFGNLAAIIISIPFYLILGRDIKFARTNKKLLTEYFKISLPVTLIGVCQVIISSFDKVFLQSQSGTIMLGNYSAAISLASFMRVIEGSIGTLLFPVFSSLLAQKEYQKINSTINQYQRFSLAFILPIIVLLSFFSHEVIALTFGNRFEFASKIFSITVVVYFLSSLTLPYSNILFGMGKFKVSALIWISASVIFLLFAYLIVSNDFLNLGGWGMSLVMVITNVFLFISTTTFVKRFFKEKISVFSGSKILLYMILFFAVSFSLIIFFKLDSLFISIIFLISLYLLFIYTGYKFKFIKDQDFEMVRKLINIKKMKQYIQNEIIKKRKD